MKLCKYQGHILEIIYHWQALVFLLSCREYSTNELCHSSHETSRFVRFGALSIHWTITWHIPNQMQQNKNQNKSIFKF